MKKIKCFTLVELLVAVAISAILLTLVASSAIFISKANETTSLTTTAMAGVRDVKDYIIEEEIVSDDDLKYENKTLVYLDNQVIRFLPFDDLSFEFSNDEIATYCLLSYYLEGKSGSIKFVVRMEE